MTPPIPWWVWLLVAVGAVVAVLVLVGIAVVVGIIIYKYAKRQKQVAAKRQNQVVTTPQVVHQQ